jgi:EAL and modified HD-GYP domain-containing signal transduction protein
MLGLPLKDALDTITLPDSVVQALLKRQGPLAPLLDLTIACETGDDAVFASAANTLGLNSSQINMAHMQALIWADSLAA